MKQALCVALIAHDRKKDAMIQLAREFEPQLGGCVLLATGTTGARLQAEVGLNVTRFLSGPLGGDLQIGAKLAQGEVDAVVFLRDPMTPQPHEPDINALDLKRKETDSSIWNGPPFSVSFSFFWEPSFPSIVC